MSIIAAIAFVVLCAVAVSLTFSLLGFAIGLVADVVALALKLLPLVIVVAVVLFFVQGGKVSRGIDGNITLELPDSWRKRR